jgi:hypothetical protein
MQRCISLSRCDINTCNLLSPESVPCARPARGEVGTAVVILLGLLPTALKADTLPIVPVVTNTDAVIEYHPQQERAWSNLCRSHDASRSRRSIGLCHWIRRKA